MRIEIFTKFLKDFSKFCVKKNYIIKDASEGWKDVMSRIAQQVRDPDSTNPDLISRYLLRHYLKEFSDFLNKDGKLVAKMIKKKRTVPPYVFDFEAFYTELQILYR